MIGGKYIAQSENLEKEYESNPQNMLEKAQELEESNQLFKARNELQNLIQKFPNSKEVSIAQDRIEKINLHLYLNSLTDIFAEKLSGSSGGELKSITLSASELVLTVSHSNCEEYDSVFIDFGVVCARAKNWDKIMSKFNRVILNFQCGGKTTKYFVTDKDLFRYLSETVSDYDLINSIKIE